MSQSKLSKHTRHNIFNSASLNEEIKCFLHELGHIQPMCNCEKFFCLAGRHARFPCRLRRREPCPCIGSCIQQFERLRTSNYKSAVLIGRIEGGNGPFRKTRVEHYYSQHYPKGS